MSARTPTPQVLARIGTLIIEAASARGVEPNGLMADAGFAPAWRTDPDARMPLGVEEALWNLAAQRCGDPCFGLHAAQGIRPGAFDVLDYAVRTAPDLRHALQRLARYNRLVHDLAGFDLVAQPGGLRVEHRFAGHGVRPCRQASEFTLASLVVVAAQIGARPVAARAVELAHPAPADIAPYLQVFGVAPRFGAAVSALEFAADDIDRPLPSADPGLSRIVTRQADQLLAERVPACASIAEQVRRQLADGMSGGPMTLRDVAQRLHLSTRSLQRRLDAEGTRFADLVDGVRHELALRYVADHRLALGEVAYLLGFAEASPFHRAFKRWTGITPAAARRALH